MQDDQTKERVATGIRPLDERLGGLQPGGVYLLMGAPGPAKLVGVLQFLHTGLAAGERGLLLTSGDAEGILAVARAWGFDLAPAWRAGRLTILGFRDDFELRALRSVEPDAVLAELGRLAEGEYQRIAVDPGSMFLGTGVQSLLGRAFLGWARNHTATVCATLSSEGGVAELPGSGDWILQAVTGRILIEPRAPGLFQVSVDSALPVSGRGDEAVTVQLRPGRGLVVPDHFPNRRREDRTELDGHRLLLAVLDDEVPADLAGWARTAFHTDVVLGSLDAVARVEGETPYGGVVVFGGRERVGEAIQTCRALRPLTQAALVFAADDGVRSSDRIHLLEAGADDCLTGGLDFRELGVRLRQAMATTSRPQARPGRDTSSTDDPASPRGGVVDREAFGAELARRRTRADDGVFCLVSVPAGPLAVSRLEERLAREIRDEDGDLVSRETHRCLILLQGARDGQARSFLTRLRARLRDELGGAEIETVWACHPAHPDEVDALLEGRVGAGT